MRFGANTFIFRSPFSTDKDLDLIPKLKEMGFDLIEVAVEDPDLVDTDLLKKTLDENNIGIVTCGAYGPGRNISSLDPVERQAAKDYLIWMIDTAEKLGSDVVNGPMYSAVGKDRLEDPADRDIEWQLAVDGLKEMAAYAEEKGVKLAFEPLNRFETDLVNVVDQGFENDRGVPGTGQVRWKEVFEALVDVGYDGNVVIESFTPEVKSIARAVCIWREIAPDQDSIARDGLKFIKSFPGIR